MREIACSCVRMSAPIYLAWGLYGQVHTSVRANQRHLKFPGSVLRAVSCGHAVREDSLHRGTPDSVQALGGGETERWVRILCSNTRSWTTDHDNSNALGWNLRVGSGCVCDLFIRVLLCVLMSVYVHARSVCIPRMSVYATSPQSHHDASEVETVLLNPGPFSENQNVRKDCRHDRPNSGHCGGGGLVKTRVLHHTQIVLFFSFLFHSFECG